MYGEGERVTICGGRLKGYDGVVVERCEIEGRQYVKLGVWVLGWFWENEVDVCAAQAVGPGARSADDDFCDVLPEATPALPERLRAGGRGRSAAAGRG